MPYDGQMTVRRTWPSEIRSGRINNRAETALSAFAFMLLAVVLYWPAPPWSAIRLPATPYGGYSFGDPAQMTWFLAWVPFALTHGLNLFHTNYLGYPHGVNLADNTLSPLLGLLGMPVTLTLGPIATFNVLLRLAFASSASSMFWVLRHRCRWSVAFVGGLIFGFGPYVVSQGQTHLDLVFVPIPPLIVWCLHELLIVRQKRPARLGLSLGLLAGAQALIDIEILVLLMITMVLGVVGGVVAARLQWRKWISPLAQALLPAVVVFMAMTGYMFWWLLVAPGHLSGPVLAPSTLQMYRADLLGPILPTFTQWLVPTNYFATAAHFVGGNYSENSTYLGVPLITLMAFVAIRWRRDRVVFTAAVLAVVAFILSLGSRLTIDGHVTSIPLPEAVFARLLFLDNTVPARFALVVSVFVVIAVAVGIEHEIVHAKSRVNSLKRVAIAESVVVVLVITSLATLIPKVPFITKPATWPTGTFRALTVIRPGSVVLTYPYAIGTDTEAMSWAAETGMRFRIMGGYATVQDFPTYGDSYPLLMKQPFVQEYLVQAQDGSQLFYRRPSPHIDPKRALCDFVARYGVDNVVWWDSGSHPFKIRQLFERTFGRPIGSTRDRSVLIWTTSPNRC